MFGPVKRVRTHMAAGVRFGGPPLHRWLAKQSASSLLLPASSIYIGRAHLFCLPVCVSIHLPALPSVCQSVHSSGGICHFCCHLNHPSVRPPVFQATHSCAFQGAPHSFIRPPCPLSPLGRLGRRCDLDFFLSSCGEGFESRKWLRPPRAPTQIRPSAPLRLNHEQTHTGTAMPPVFFKKGELLLTN